MKLNELKELVYNITTNVLREINEVAPANAQAQSAMPPVPPQQPAQHPMQQPDPCVNSLMNASKSVVKTGKLTNNCYALQVVNGSGGNCVALTTFTDGKKTRAVSKNLSNSGQKISENPALINKLIADMSSVPDTWYRYQMDYKSPNDGLNHKYEFLCKNKS